MLLLAAALAGFQEVPVGARPAAMGGAYGALAADSYAPVWNPGGLGLVREGELSTTHLSYVGKITYDSVGFARSGWGAAAQYFRLGEQDATDLQGNPAGTFGGHAAVYSLAYGRAVTPSLSLGLAGRFKHSRVDGEGASDRTADAGALWRPLARWSFSMVGGEDSVRAGAAFKPAAAADLAAEGVRDRDGALHGRFGGEWRPHPLVALRAGYRSDSLRENSALAGLTSGLGLSYLGQEFGYSWLPLGDLGSTHYFSLVLRFKRPP